MAARVKAKAGPWLPAAAAAGLTLVFIVFKGEEMSGFLQLSHLGRSVLRPMARAMVFMVIGLTAAMLIEALGWTTRLARLAAPLTRRARLPRAAAASFATAVVSNPAANAMLSE
ncbi:MAG: hypothetical protein LBS31_11835, partial [Candidatus Adiutrix sp.]|nr:hypothetical protein [Candidatus Adiutrix sp.]